MVFATDISWIARCHFAKCHATDYPLKGRISLKKNMLAMPATFDGARTIPSPQVTDLMLELLRLTPQDKVLEIGTGSGYQTRRFAETGAEIHSIELEPYVDPTISLGECVYLYHRDGFEGLPHEAPFSAIVATCGVSEIPRSWGDQLAVGGRLVAPVGEARSQRLCLFSKDQSGPLNPKKVLAYTRFQMLRRIGIREPIKPVYKVRPDAVE